ncbi:MAG: DUF5107 domain-containing protein [Fimbriimonadaceae bacterium]|nr:DUF5107 domain-containing protein [Fimbriimonadaceae bacterium]
MALELFEDLIDLTLPGAAPVPLTLGRREPCHPLPRLRAEGSPTPRSLRTVVIQNPFLRAEILLDLGGRLIRFTDRRTGRDILPFRADPPLATTGDRGLELPAGIVPWPAGGLVSLARVDHRLQEPEDEESAGAVFLHALIPGTEASFHAAWTMPPDRAEILFEMRLFNRALTANPVGDGLRIFAGPGRLWMQADGSTAFWSTDGVGMRLDSSAWGAWSAEGGFLSHDPRARAAGPLFSRETASWSVRLTPFSSLEEPSFLGREIGVGRTERRLLIQAAERRLDSVLTLAASDDEFAAEVDLNPESIFAADLETLPPLQRLRLDDLDWIDLQPEERPVEPPGESALRMALLAKTGVEAEALEALASGSAPASPSPPLNPACQIARARLALAREDRAEAEAALEDALGQNAEDALAWWMKAWIARLEGREDRPELLNAHFLTPMEPLLRAEAFLQQGALQGREPNPAVAPLAKNPDAGLECVAELLRAGAYREAGLLMDELLRHEEIGLVRVLYAWLLAERSRMEVEAARHLQELESRPLQPPFPWRREEVRAIRRLAERHPRLERLQELKQMVEGLPE